MLQQAQEGEYMNERYVDYTAWLTDEEAAAVELVVINQLQAEVMAELEANQ
jgi:hypothetical protein